MGTVVIQARLMSWLPEREMSDGFYFKLILLSEHFLISCQQIDCKYLFDYNRLKPLGEIVV